jgi:hypothetical protein
MIFESHFVQMLNYHPADCLVPGTERDPLLVAGDEEQNTGVESVAKAVDTNYNKGSNCSLYTYRVAVTDSTHTITTTQIPFQFWEILQVQRCSLTDKTDTIVR